MRLSTMKIVLVMMQFMQGRIQILISCCCVSCPFVDQGDINLDMFFRIEMFCSVLGVCCSVLEQSRYAKQ